MAPHSAHVAPGVAPVALKDVGPGVFWPGGDYRGLWGLALPHGGLVHD